MKNKILLYNKANLHNKYYFITLAIFVLIFTIFFVVLIPELSIYGESIISKTEVKNLKLISDTISKIGKGIIRIKGNPEYYNGKNLGEICVKINAYITDEDFAKLKLKKETLSNHCYEVKEHNMGIDTIRENAEIDAKRKIIAKYNPNLQNIQPQNLNKLVRFFKKLKGNYDDNLDTYCIDVEAYLIPIEIELYEEQNTIVNPKGVSIKTESKLIKGDCKRIRAERDLRHCNFKEANLESQNFYGVDLSGVDLSRAKLRWARFVNANLSNANLQGADLRYTTFSKSILIGANFENARFDNTNFTEADISNADLYYVIDVSEAIYIKTIVITFNIIIFLILTFGPSLIR